MTFDGEDERGYYACRDELCTRFAEWAQQEHNAADAGDVELLLDWKWGYGDGRLDRFDAADVEEFLLDWCPRKLASPPELIAGIPGSVAAYVDFLAEERLLAPGCSAVAVRRACTDLAPRFRREMADPANFGMAKSLLGGLDRDPNALLERLAELTGTSADEVLDLLEHPEPAVIGPVRAPTDDEVAGAITRARMLGQVRGLAARCAAPGLTLTAKGNLRLADARRLTAELETGDEPDTAYRTRSASELPHLSWLVDTAIAAGAVRRLRGRLVAVARFADRTDRDAYKRVVRAALDVGLGSPMSWALLGAPDDGDFAVTLIAELLDAGEDGASADDIVGHIGPLLGRAGLFGGVFGGSAIAHQLGRLADLGLVTAADDDGLVTLTAAGRSIGAELVAEAGVEVVFRADPATADAVAMVTSMLMLSDDEARADLTAWAVDHPSGAGEVVAAALHTDHGPGDVLGLLELAGAVFGAAADAAAATHRDGPHAALTTMWLLLRGAIEASAVDPEVMLVGTVEVAAAMLDDAGPEGIVEFFGTDVDQTTDVLNQLWRAEHERTVEVLDVLGHHHPDKKIAKAARRSLMKARSRG
jgi:hypothetical protein